MGRVSTRVWTWGGRSRRLYLSATSSGLAYLSERFEDFPHRVHMTLQGRPCSVLVECAKAHL
ncbi:hypothetical protein AO738_03460 [Pseudomonas citronellolis]|nr:hypothetical protein AO742_21105 [Pseudomonas citronellolis]KRW77611.1 hypothetical protein AO738_03460 [Pseudomonas citronellolis]